MIMTGKDDTHWYALRTTYGQEHKAYLYLTEHNCKAYLPTLTRIIESNGKKKKETVSRLPNIFFARSSFETLKTFVYDNVNLPFLRFYYESRGTGVDIIRRPLIVPDIQMKSLMIVCGSLSPDVLHVPRNVTKFNNGQKVIITDGDFKGIEGRVARWHGQQRVAVIIEGLCTVATAYIPSAFLKPSDE